MRKSIHLLFVSALVGALLPVTVWGYGFAAYPRDRNHLPHAESSGGHHYSGSLRLQTGMTGGGYYLRIHLDGLRPGDIHVSLQRNYLVVQIAQGGQYGTHNSTARRAMQWQMHVRRQLRIPYDADVTRMTTSMKNGIMEIYMPTYQAPK
jgi:HSP20 family molecular chaperone IbpA